MRQYAERMNHAQPGDPAKLAKAMIVLADAKTPPNRLPLGSDTLERVQAKNRGVEAVIAQWGDLARSTDGVAA